MPRSLDRRPGSNPFAASIDALIAEIARLSGASDVLDPRHAVDRSDSVVLAAPGVWSANRSCRFVRAADAWMAVNLPRDADRALVPAWIGGHARAKPWAAVLAHAARTPARTLLGRARLLGLAVSRVGETRAAHLVPTARRMAAGRGGARGALRVVDISSLWAGPLCGYVFARLGAEVVKIESRHRPDTSRGLPGTFFARLNDGKAHMALDFGDPAGRRELRDALTAADVVITSARARAFDQLGLSPATMFEANPGLTWVAVTGHGWLGRGTDRVAFGDDAAAAGGLVRYTRAGAPRFFGDAVADPLTGLAAAVGALRAIRRGGGFLVDAAMARCAAGAVAQFAAGGEHAWRRAA